MEGRKMKLGTSYQRNGIRFWIGRWTNVITGLEYKRPVLAVKVDGDNTIYKLASFDSEEKAGWFVDLFGEYAAQESAEWVEGVCSECRREAVSGFKTRYCPHCGRRMIGGEE
jgi:hypothetical protein